VHFQTAVSDGHSEHPTEGQVAVRRAAVKMRLPDPHGTDSGLARVQHSFELEPF
jgi:hypothetical protein